MKMTSFFAMIRFDGWVSGLPAGGGEELTDMHLSLFLSQ